MPCTAEAHVADERCLSRESAVRETRRASFRAEPASLDFSSTMTSWRLFAPLMGRAPRRNEELPDRSAEDEEAPARAPERWISKVPRFVASLLPVPLTLAFQLAFWAMIRPFGLFLFVQAVYISSWIGGLYAGLISTAVSTVIVHYYFVPTERAFLPIEPRHVLVLTMFAALGVVISLFHERFKQANRALGESLAQGRRTNDLLRRANDEVSRLYVKTKEVDELKTHLFAGVSHELRTPLTLVLGPAERLIASASTEEAVRRDVEVIARNARTLVHYVNDLLEVTKLEARAVEPDYAETDIARLARFVASQFEKTAHANRVAYAIEAPNVLRGEVDAPRLERVLSNLLSNAFKLTPEGGHVRLTVREDVAKKQLVFEVADSGPGIPPDRREAAFEAYFQRRATPEGAGTGLGLSMAIARALVTLHGGSIRIADAPEGGALFVVELPRNAPSGTAVRATGTARAPETLRIEAPSSIERSAPPRPHAAGLSGREGRPTVLVVEDNPDMNDAICEALRDEYRVATAFDGKEGLRLAIELVPDLVLTDVMMPQMGGEELVHALRAHSALSATPAIVLTAVADDQARARLLREGARDYLTKPFRVEELLARVESAVAQTRAEREIRTLSAQLEAVNRASMSVAEAVARLPRESVEAVLHTIAAQAQTLTGAEYVAVGLGTDPEKAFDPWVFVGVSGEQSASIGRFPRPVGVLGVVARGNEALRIRDVRSHPAYRGFPADHPEMSSFLGVPLRYHDRVVGHVYLANKRGGDEFTEADQTVVEMLASRAGVALETAHLYEAEGIGRAWLEAVIEQLPDAVIVLDASGRVATLNRAATALRGEDAGRRDPFGNPLPFELHLPSGELMDPERIPYVRAFARGETVIGMDLRIRKASGELLPVSASAVPIRGPEGELTGAAALFRDVSVQKELERTREEWSAVIAHDLRQPVGVIGMAAELAQQGDLGPAAKKQLDRIRRANRRLKEMIDELLDVTRLESHRLAIAPAKIDVAATAREVCDRVDGTCVGHSVSVRESGGAPVAWADAGRVEQVITNLVSNACKYGQADKEIRVDVDGRADEVEVSVTNRGPGIAPDELPQMFQRFMRSKEIRRSGIEGIGLGLYICKGLVEAHGGRIWVESTPGETTSFHFTLPARPAASSSS
ncbi:MAG: response regulator [Labilithrix sp.]|nr:response regulator [Labilithrix sp.]